jgi:transposase
MYIAFDSHKKYTFASVAKPAGGVFQERRIEHRRGAVKAFLSAYESKSPVAIETIGSWYWIVDEIEAAGMLPQLVHARKAKVMMGMINKTDKLDARGMNRLQQNGTLPIVWIPPAELRDQRDLARTRMMFSNLRTKLKNKIHANLDKYALSISEVSDIFGVTGRKLINERLPELPSETRYATEQLLKELDHVQEQIAAFEKRMHEVFEENPDLALLKTLPGVGFILGMVLLLELGDVNRFASNEHMASYGGTTPRVHSSGGKTRFGQLRSDVNHYVKWAFMEAANHAMIHHKAHPERHVSRLYNRIRQKKGHPKAIGAVARHLAEATYWILKKKTPYQEPKTDHSVSSTEG